MGNSSPDDPYEWGVERLSQELCGEGRGWAPSNPLKRPDPTALEAALNEHQIDGETLLTWDDFFSSHNDLFRDLGLSKASHRLTIAKAIAWLKKHSPAYHQAKARNQQESQQTDAGPDRLETTKLSSSANRTVSSEEPLQKKRRLAPQLISSEVRNVGLAPLPTAADGLRTTPTRRPEEFWASPRPSYLGHGKLVLGDYVPRNSLKGRPAATPDNESKEFSWTLSSGRFPPGRQMQMKRGMIRLFQANSSYAAQIRDNVAYMDNELSSPASSEDVLLPVFGESDGEYDAETIREMEEEASAHRQVSGMLSMEQAKIVVNGIIEEYAERWNEAKLERYQRKAYPLWRSASLKGRNDEILRTAKRLTDLEDRIRKLVIEILAQDWPNESSLRRQSRCLEASIDDRQYFRWFLELLKGREPPRVPAVPRRLQARKPKTVVDLSDDDADFITSDSDSSDGLITNNGFSTPHRASTSPHGEAFELPHRLPRSPAVLHSQPMDVIDLVTPESSRHVDPSGDEAEVFVLTPEQLAIPFSRPQDIGDIGIKAWRQYKDAKRMLISLLWKKKPEWRDKIFKLVQSQEPNDLWDELIIPACNAKGPALNAAPSKLQVTLARIFWQFAYCDISTAVFSKALGTKLKQQIPLKRDAFPSFVDFLRQDVIPNFPGPVGDAARQALLTSGKEVEMTDAGVNEKSDADSDQEMEDEMDAHTTALTPSRRGRRQRRIIRDQDAERMRQDELRRREADHARKAAFQTRMQTSTTISADQARLIINVTKEGDDDAAFITVSQAEWEVNGIKTPSIAERIKDHQIEGIRFMWDHMMANQGCLLAHTMGLGKTMQIIALLVAIREAANSESPSISSQIPKELRGTTKFLVLCPSGLGENWKEEFAKWAPPDVFGDSVHLIDSTNSKARREFEAEQWAKNGGVLILGYPMFRVLYHSSEKLAKILTDKPDIVIADEAHYLKNRTSKVSEASVNIKTLRRLALTGTPLANNVGEFYSTIDWISPNYLGPWNEFQQVYVAPIEDGLWGDSTPAEYRKAKKMLAALERTVAPKTHRLTSKCLKEQLPGKIEFVVTVPMLPLQAQLYGMYISSIREASGTFKHMQATSFAVTSNLILLSNHPRCFHQKLLRERDRRNNQSVADEETTDTQTEESPDHTITNAFLTSALTLLNRQRDVASTEHSWKVHHLVTILDECRLTGEKVLVFSHSLITLHYLDNVLRQQGRSLQKLVGLVKPAHRLNMVKAFNEVPAQEVFLISTTAGGIGLNITGASRVVIFDFKYNPILEQQAIGRAYRIGQTRRVVVYRFLAGGTHEQKIHNKAVFKQQLASRVVDKENPKRMAKSKFGDLVQPLKDVPQDDLREFLGKDKIMDKMLETPGSVRSLLSTDAFEEEDITDTALSAEERKEVERMCEMNRIRNTDPERYRLLESQRVMGQAAAQHQLLAEAAARHAPSQQAPQVATYPATPRPPYAPQAPSQPGPSPMSNGHGLPPNADGTQLRPPPPPPPTQPTAPSSSVNRQPVMPMVTPGSSAIISQRPNGASASHGSGSATLVISPSTRRPDPSPTPPITSGPMSSPSGSSSYEERLQRVMLTFEERVLGTISDVSRSRGIAPPMTAQELREHTGKAARGIRQKQTQRDRGFLPDKARWNYLIDVAASPTFCRALFDDKLDLEALAWGDVENYCQSNGYVSVTTAGTPSPSQGRTQKDPNHLRNALARSKSNQHATDSPKKGSRAHEDLIAMRQVADRRKQRPLPKWASEALEESQ